MPAARASAEQLPGFVELVQRGQRRDEIRHGRNEPGIEPHRFPERRDGLLILPERPGRQPEAVERERFSRIRRGPRSRELESLVPRLDGVAVVAPRDEVPLAFAHAIAEVEGPARPLRRERRLTGVGVDPGQQRLREGEVRIELDGPLQVRNGLEAWIDTAAVEGQRIGLQRVERGRRGPGQRHVVVLDRRERLAEAVAAVSRPRPPARSAPLPCCSTSTCSRAITSPLSALTASRPTT